MIKCEQDKHQYLSRRQSARCYFIVINRQVCLCGNTISRFGEGELHDKSKLSTCESIFKVSQIDQRIFALLACSAILLIQNRGHLDSIVFYGCFLHHNHICCSPLISSCSWYTFSLWLWDQMIKN